MYITMYSKSPTHETSSLNFQRYKRAFHQHEVWVKFLLVLCLLLLIMLQLCHLLSPLLSPVCTLLAGSLDASPCIPAAELYILPYFLRYCTVRLKMFFVFLVSLYEKYKSITVQYYITSCVSWVPRLTLLDLWTNLTYECILEMEHVHM